MDATFSCSHAYIKERLSYLDAVKSSLKKDFYGIDHIIGSVIDTIIPWFVMPQLQDRPLIVNLWGMTGTGKSSLVIKLAEKLGFADKFYQYDLGTNNFGYRMYNDLYKFNEGKAGNPLIIVLDEFQNARTIEENGKEKEPSEVKAVWSLLDSGKLLYSPWNNRDSSEHIHNFMIRIAQCIEEGIQIRDCKLIGNEEIYRKIMSTSDEELSTLTDRDISVFLPFYPNPTLYGMRKIISKLNEYEIYELLSDLHAKALRQANIEVSKALIFIIGNIDEAFNMNGDLNPDIDPDMFREITLKITVPKIKRALQRRFRNEQISRLGNIHLIYPALGSNEYKRIIRVQLDLISETFRKATGVLINFDSSVEDLVFEEGVYPSQGTRPLFSTLHYLVKSKLSRLLADFYNGSNQDFNKLKISIRDDNLIANGFYKNILLGTREYKCSMELTKLRENKKDDNQAITSVHEAGHAVLAALLLNRIPEIIRSRTADANTSGFVSGNIFDTVVSKSEIKNRIAVLLGGIVAEELIFSETRATDGSSSDIQKATAFALESAKENGMSSKPLYYGVSEPKSNRVFHEQEANIEAEAEKWIIEAKDLATTSLRDNESFLLSIADLLFQKTLMTKQDFEDVILTFFPNFIEKQLISNDSKGEYVDILHRKVMNMKEIRQEGESHYSGSTELVAYSRKVDNEE